MNGFEEPRWYIYGETDTGQSWLDRETEVVRCRDCVHRASDPLGEYCTLFDFEDMKNPKELDGFCAWGERRDA